MALLVILAGFMLLSSADASISCQSSSGNSVDWFVVYKLPRIDDSTASKVREGSGFIYADADGDTFELSKTAINDDRGAVAYTFDQVYNAKKNGDIAYALYNDEDPTHKEHFYNGHTKGGMAFDGQSGFWMIDSVPGFPPYVKDGFGYPHSGLMYGQMFLCVTYNSSTFDDIGYQLRVNDPHIHDSQLPDSMEHDFPNVKKALDGDMVNESPYFSVKHFTSLGGVSFLHFAKSRGFGDDLYAALVAPTLKVNLLAATWQRGSKRLGPSCDDYTVENIKQMHIEVDGKTFSFSNEDDHSKYAIAKTDQDPYVCIGDINRMGTQFTRGGGTCCFLNKSIWKQFRGMVADIESC